jgi:hypothetical protein
MAPLLFMGGLQALQFYIKERMEASLERDALQTIALPAAEAIWYEGDKELLINGKLFDVKAYTTANGVLTAKGIFDEQETEVINLLNSTWSETQQTHLVIQLLLLSHCLLLFTFYIANFGTNAVLLKRYPFPPSYYFPPLLSVLTPPPKALRFPSF